MGLLMLAGGLKGAGNAAERGLLNFQSAMTSKMFRDDEKDFAREQADTAYKRGRFDLESERAYTLELLKRKNDLDTQRQQKEFDHATGLLATKQAFDEKQLDRTLAATATETDKKLVSGEKMKAQELGIKDKLGSEDNRLRAEYHDILKQIRGLAVSGKSGTSAEVKKSTEYLKDILNERLKGLQTMLPLATGEERDRIQEDIDQVMHEARRVAGIDEPTPKAGPEIKDRFASPGATKGQPTPKTSAARAGEDFTVKAKRPMIPRGTLDPVRLGKIRKQQLDYEVLEKRKELEHARIHRSPKIVASLEQELRAMEARQDSGTP